MRKLLLIIHLIVFSVSWNMTSWKTYSSRSRTPLSTLFRPDNADANEPSQPPTLLGLHPLVLFARLSSLIRRSPDENDASNELQQPSTPSRFHPHALMAHISSHFLRSQLFDYRSAQGNGDLQGDYGPQRNYFPQPSGPSAAAPQHLYDLFSSEPEASYSAAWKPARVPMVQE
jgi:hypothetical protein